MTEENQDDGMDQVSDALGTDPVEASAEQPQEDVRAGEQEQSSGTAQVTEQELQQLREAAMNYHTLTSDPKASALLRDYYSSQLGQGQQRSLPPASGAKEEEIDDKEKLSILEKAVQEGGDLLKTMQRSIGELRWENFTLKNPDASKYQSEIGTLLQRGVDLQEAYELAKHRAGLQQQREQHRTVRAESAAPTVETGGAGEVPSGDALQEAIKAINSRKATPGDSYIRKALEVAQQMHKG